MSEYIKMMKQLLEITATVKDLVSENLSLKAYIVELEAQVASQQSVQADLGWTCECEAVNWQKLESCGICGKTRPSRLRKSLTVLEKKMTESEYKERYKKRLIELGLDEAWATAQADGAEFDPTDPEPEDHAEDCYSYILEDSR